MQKQITSKNLEVLQEQLHHEALACKKSSAYESLFVDPALKGLSRDISSHHKAHFDALNQYLNSHN